MSLRDMLVDFAQRRGINTEEDVDAFLAGWEARGDRPLRHRCSECGVESTKDSMWALYCIDCVEKHLVPAFESAELQRLRKWERDVLAWHAESKKRIEAAGSWSSTFMLGKWWGERPWFKRG